MGNRSSDYVINATTFRVAYGDITKVVAEALVSSDDNFSCRSPVCARIWRI
jgi:hypothetical protein